MSTDDPLTTPPSNAQGIDSLGAGPLQRLLEISTRLSSTLRLSELLNLVMDVSIELTDTEAASILLVDRSSGQLHFVASTSGGVPEETLVPLDGSIAGWVVRNGRSLIIDDVKGDKRHYASVDEDLAFNTHSMLAVPLVTPKGVIGTLEVLNKRDHQPYTQQDIAVLEALASQSAVAIVNAHLFNQSDLLAEVMHEIKTPIMAISSAAALLSRPDVAQERHGMLINMIKQESERLSKMTRDFLDFARLESGRERLEKLPIDVTAVINEVVQISQAQASERGIELVVEGADLLAAASGTAVVGDRDRLKQVLLNLVSNATKYNRDNGRVTIAQQLAANELQLCVRDTGPGISEEDLAHLFERFYRIPGSKREGTGLGLSVAQKIVEEHRGRIEVSSTLGVGTTFAICLPLTAVRPQTD